MTTIAQFEPHAVVPVVGILTTFVLFPIAIGVARYIWRRAGEPARPQPSDDTSRQLAQMQQSLDAMAIEIERISEGQRFVTRLLADRQPAPALRKDSEPR